MMIYLKHINISLITLINDRKLCQFTFPSFHIDNSNYVYQGRRNGKESKEPDYDEDKEQLE